LCLAAECLPVATGTAKVRRMLGSLPRRFVRRFVAWSCLAFSLLSALTPAQGVVLCVEPEGAVTIEGAFDAACCAEGSTSPEIGAGAVTRNGAVDQAERSRPGCPCIDVPLVSVAEQRRNEPRSGVPGPDHVGVQAPAFAELDLADLAARRRQPCASVPHASPLALERSVILRV